MRRFEVVFVDASQEGRPQHEIIEADRWHRNLIVVNQDVGAGMGNDMIEFLADEPSAAAAQARLHGADVQARVVFAVPFGLVTSIRDAGGPPSL